MKPKFKVKDIVRFTTECHKAEYVNKVGEIIRVVTQEMDCICVGFIYWVDPLDDSNDVFMVLDNEIESEENNDKEC